MDRRPFPGLRSVVSLYPEPVTVMARADSHIQDLAGLAGRRVNVGSRGTGIRATWDAPAASMGSQPTCRPLASARPW
jgi:uncharacterized protein